MKKGLSCTHEWCVKVHLKKRKTVIIIVIIIIVWQWAVIIILVLVSFHWFRVYVKENCRPREILWGVNLLFRKSCSVSSEISYIFKLRRRGGAASAIMSHFLCTHFDPHLLSGSVPKTFDMGFHFYLCFTLWANFILYGFMG